MDTSSSLWQCVVCTLWSGLWGHTHQRRSICHDRSGLGNITNSPGCRYESRIALQLLQSRCWTCTKHPSLCTQKCATVCGVMSKAPLPACSHVILFPLTAWCSLAAALPSCAGDLTLWEEMVVLVSPAPSSLLLISTCIQCNTFLPVFMCICVCVCWGGSARVWSTRSVAALLPGGGCISCQWMLV